MQNEEILWFCRNFAEHFYSRTRTYSVYNSRPTALEKTYRLLLLNKTKTMIVRETKNALAGDYHADDSFQKVLQAFLK